MHEDNLVKMANQIDAFFEAMPDRGEAIEGIALHIKKFWEPRMRLALLAHIDSDGGADLDSMVAEAIRQHRGTLGG